MISSERPFVQEISDKMQSKYRYVLIEPEGQNFGPQFQPELTPKQMLFLGDFGGKYMTDCTHEYPYSWFENAKLCSKRHISQLTKHCAAGDIKCRPKQRQALLHWAYDSRIL